MKPSNVTRGAYTNCLAEKLFLAIRNTFLMQRHTSALVKQDNAKPHVSLHDPRIKEASTGNHRKIRMVNQPPNSPDFNVLDFGFFKSLQSIQHNSMFTSLPEMVRCVEEAYENYLSEKVSNVFLTLKSVLESIMIKYGDNKLKIQHQRKHGLNAREKENFNLKCNSEYFRGVMNRYRSNHV